MNCPNNKIHEIILIEYSWDHLKHYDGISEIWCKTEDKKFGRWCNKELAKGESENVFCKGESHL